MPKDIQSTINFIPANLEVKSMTGTADFYTHANDRREVTIHDIRGREKEFTLSINGFIYITHDSQHIPITEPTTIKRDLYEETADLLRNSLQPSPTRVRIASHTIRSSFTDLDSEYTGTLGPACAAHLDHTPTGAKKYLYEKFPCEEASQLSKTRWAIINVWRPLKAIKRDPLAVCDGHTLQKGDLLPIRMDYSANTRAKDGDSNLRTTVEWEIAMCKYGEQQKWYYLSEMGVNDVLLMKIYDSSHGDAPGVAVHSSFEDPNQDETVEPRESIELRCLVFWEDMPLNI
ncbi:GA4 desaturase family protein [Aspergillus terreus]|uniref:GA4 desaturase family protein n=1 Tax=Aspergillus terreus TaxID=33178 RepID=A0A5M3Z4J1_ASPTE|nr:hypothetical protein ATETN484_0007019400 [Aspergillus terreus]GFF15999.1 GA4 desaturase family protein [Aspergillus terreus]